MADHLKDESIDGDSEVDDLFEEEWSDSERSIMMQNAIARFFDFDSSPTKPREAGLPLPPTVVQSGLTDQADSNHAWTPGVMGNSANAVTSPFLHPAIQTYPTMRPIDEEGPPSMAIEEYMHRMVALDTILEEMDPRLLDRICPGGADGIMSIQDLF